MRPSLPKTLVLSLALIFSQWLVAAHAGEHLALDAKPSAEVCLHVHALGGALPSARSALPRLLRRAEAPPALAAGIRARRQAGLHPIRGPPLLP